MSNLYNYVILQLYDSEVDEILKTHEPIQMQKLRNSENRGAGTQNLHLSTTLGEEKQSNTARSVSPLLSNSEKEAYTVSIYTPGFRDQS